MSRKEIQAQLQRSNEALEPLQIIGGGSKSFLGGATGNLPQLSTASLDQLLQYDPAELVVRVQSGMKVRALREVLAADGQMLGFDPPEFDGDATIGGTLAAGLSGSRRPFAGSGRDFVLGIGLLDGTGQYFEFGGQVMKNVAGYDVSRLMIGAMGCLGLLTEFSLKVLPLPEVEQTWIRDVDRDVGHRELVKLNRVPGVTAAAWREGQLTVRFSGYADSVAQSAKHFGGNQADESPWEDIDNIRFRAGLEQLYRVIVPPASSYLLDEAIIIDWGGRQRWVTAVRQPVPAGVQVHLVKSGVVNEGAGESGGIPSMPDYLKRVHRGLKQRFDPNAILNPQRLFEWL